MGETLDSVIAQLYQNWECLVIDDGSADHTEELMAFYIENDKRIKFFKRPDSLLKGANNCRNYGFEMSTGEYINWFDDDDIMLPEFLSERIEHMEKGVEIIICSFFPVDRSLNRKTAALSLKKTFSLFKSYALYELKLITNSLLFKRKILMNRTLFLPGLEYGDETELFLRIFYQEPEPKYIIIDKPLFLYRQHDNSKSKQNEKPDPAFRYSIIFVALQNLSRGIQMEDNKIIKFYYKRIIPMFFRSLEAGQQENAEYLLKEIIPLIRKINKVLSMEIYFWGRIFLFFRRGSFKIEKRLKHYLN